MPKGMYDHKCKDPVERFWAKVDTSTDCWLWTAATKKGYGYFFDGSRMVQAHRYAYQLLVGPIPDGLELDHQVTCPKRCVRPDHMRPATRKQNGENWAGSRVGSRSGVRGVAWHKQAKRWRARVVHYGKEISIGLFDTVEEARSAVIAKRNELFTHNDVDREVLTPREKTP